MSFNDKNFFFGNYNFAVDTVWQENVSNSEQPFVPPRGNMEFLDGTDMIYLDGDRMSYLET